MKCQRQQNPNFDLCVLTDKKPCIFESSVTALLLFLVSPMRKIQFYLSHYSFETIKIFCIASNIKQT